MKMPNSKSFDFTDNAHERNTSGRCQIKTSRKFCAIFIGMILLVLCVFFGGFYAGRTSVIGGQESTTETTTQTTEPDDFTATEINWDGFCPKRSGTCPTSYEGTPLLLLISLDGFRPDYMTRGYTPTIYNLSQCGTKAPFMYPVFPSKTFPNHYSQVTGLFPVNHGIIDNSMYDPGTRKVFKIGASEYLKPYWWLAEPIWVTAQKQGKKSGCFFWPGSEAKINSTYPTYYKKYNKKIAYGTRVETVLSWMDKPVNERPSFYTLYVNQPDDAAHANGTEHESVNVQLERVDNMINLLFAGLQERSLLDCVNVIMVSDHGMTATSCDRTISLGNYLNTSEVHAVAGAFGRIRPKGRKNITAEQNILELFQCSNDHLRGYRKENLPIRLHYASSPRIEPIFLDLDAGWMISNYEITANNSFCEGANHGYDNWYPDMQALFMAIGPSFKTNHIVEPFSNIELYELMTELINITAQPNNGTKGSLHHLLNEPQLLPAQPTYSPPPRLEVPSEKWVIGTNVRTSNCSGSEVIYALNMSDSDVSETSLFNALNMNESDVSESRLRHLPFGIPQRHFDGETLRLLYHSDYVSAFDLKYKLPLWTAYSISRKVNFSEAEPEWIADARVWYEDTTKCTFYKDPKVVGNEVLQRPLFPIGFAQESEIEVASLVTNSVPKTKDHVKHYEKAFHAMLAEWAEQEGSINVVTGPAFDLLYSGVYPEVGRIMETHDKYGPLVGPTHYYAVVTWCKSDSIGVSDCESSNLDVAAFLLPNDPVPDNCESSEDKIIKNAARVADIEILTGISFFTQLPVYDAIRLRTAVPQRQRQQAS